jgi:CBS domain-containing protein
VLRRVVDEARNPDTVRVAEVMTRDVLTVEPGTTVEEVMATMTARRLRHLPVVDNGLLVGMISIGDVTRWISVNQEAHIQHMTDYITGRA